MNGLPIFIPIRVGIGAGPILFELVFNIGVPFGIFAPVVSLRAVAEAQGRFHIVVIGLASRRDGLLARGLFDRVVDVLIGIGFFATEVVLRLSS